MGFHHRLPSTSATLLGVGEFIRTFMWASFDPLLQAGFDVHSDDRIRSIKRVIEGGGETEGNKRKSELHWVDANKAKIEVAAKTQNVKETLNKGRVKRQTRS